MLINLVMLFGSFVTLMAFMFSLYVSVKNNTDSTMIMVGVIVSMIFIVFLMFVNGAFSRTESLSKIQKKWKFKSNEEAKEYLNLQYSGIECDKDKKDILAKLLFFGWNIVETKEKELTLERVSSTKTEKMIFNTMN